MKKLMTFCLLLALALPMAAVEDDQVMYAGGTAPALRVGVVGRLDTTSEQSLTFKSSGTELQIPYADIQSFEYSKEVTRHLGVLPAIGVGLVKMRRHRHYRISYRGADNVSQVAVFEFPKHMPRTLRAVLEARAPQTCKPCVLRAGRN
jgi:phosphosulfolactate synthase (CoM biosynthesis protein A)